MHSQEKKLHALYKTPVAVFLLLYIMAGLLLYRGATKTATNDEPAHIVAGYGNLVKQDYRLNPEHPPLIKMFSAFFLLFQNVNFVEERPSWQRDINNQWTAGDEFLHWEGNNPVSLLFLGRIGPIIITLLTGLITFAWTKKLYGYGAGIFALILFVFSPTFLAHGSLITTDVGAAFGFLFAIYYFLKYLQNQNKKNLLMAGVAFGIAQLLKFSLILLAPYFFIVSIGWILFRDRQKNILSKQFISKIFYYLGRIFLIGIIGLIIIYPFYQYSVLRYPIENQVKDTNALLSEHPWNEGVLDFVPDTVRWMADKPILRAYGHFFLGQLIVFKRISGGNTVYFLGDVATTAWYEYFPVVFLLKVPTALILMIAIAVLITLKKGLSKTINRLKVFNGKIKNIFKIWYEIISKYFIETSIFLFISFYWILSITGNLNIGIRHVLPTFPFIYILLAGIFSKWLFKGFRFEPEEFKKHTKQRRSKVILLTALITWYIVSSLISFPHMIPYFNELAGGASNGYKYVADSNLDWGQDLRTLVQYTKENDIDQIKLAYFGGGNPQYYFCEDLLRQGKLEECDRWTKLNPFNENERSGWIAVSGTILQEGRANAVKGYTESTTHYEWLNKYEPIKVIGNSIFVYYID